MGAVRDAVDDACGRAASAADHAAAADQPGSGDSSSARQAGSDPVHTNEVGADDQDVRHPTSQELMEQARRQTFVTDPNLVARIDAAIERATAADDSAELGQLLLVKMLAVQTDGDPTVSAELTAAAVPHLVRADDMATAASAAAMAAVFTDQCGDIKGATEHAVQSMVLLGQAPDDDDSFGAVRALNALAGLFCRLCAFDVAIDLGRKAFDLATSSPEIPTDHVAYSFGYIAAEGAHVATDEISRAANCAHTLDAARWLREHGTGVVPPVMLAPALEAEAMLASGEVPDLEELLPGEIHYEGAVGDLVAWHRLVVGSTLLLHGRPDAALERFDLALPGLEESGDNHCVVRALEGRTAALSALGDHEAALETMRRLASTTRRWQLEQVGQLSTQVVRRAELEQTQELLRLTAERLADDVDLDPITGVRSRHWLEREIVRLADHDELGWVLMLDLDRFKSINDEHGHHVGDQVLRRFGLLASTTVGPAGEVARFGGEEFVVFCHGDGDPRSGPDVAEDLRAAVEAEDWSAIAPGLGLTVSCGAVEGLLADVRHLVVRADEALLVAKREGRNRVSVARPSDG
ncbi:MAG: GGDEF domain-containing protein [Actinomycetota bacterium]